MTKPSSSSSSCSDKSLNQRLKTIFRKAYELSTLCEIEVCVIHYGPNGELKTWPEKKEIVKDMALRYVVAKKRKTSLNLQEFKEKKIAKEEEKDPKKKKKKGIKYPDWYPDFDHYSPQQLSELIQSLELTLIKLQERLRFIEAKKKQRMKTEPLNPNNQFSMCMYNHGESSTLSTSQCNQLTNYQNFGLQDNLMMMKQGLIGYDQNNMCMNVLPPVQASQWDNLGFDNDLMMQQKLCDSYQNMSGITNNNNNFLGQTSLSNTLLPVEFCSGFDSNAYGDMVGSCSTSFTQEFPLPDTLSTYGESSRLQTSSLYTFPNGYFQPESSSFL